MEPALVGALVAIATGVALKVADWGMARSGRQIAGRRDLREEIKLLWDQVNDLKREVHDWQDRYRKLEADYDELLRRYQVLLAEVTQYKRVGNGPSESQSGRP